MIKIFKSDYPIVIIFTLIALIAFRIPLFISEVPVLQLELKWIVAGEKLSEGGFLYRDLLTTLEPFSAGVYWISYLITGRSVLFLRTTAIVIIFLQAILISVIIRKRKSFEKVGYLPSFIYILLTSVSWEFNTLSPQLMGCTFLILSLSHLFNMPAEKNADNQILFSGVYVGIATLFYFPYITFLALIWFSMALYRSDNFRELLLVLVGFLGPVLGVGLYYYFNNCLYDFISSLFPLSSQQPFSFKPSYHIILIILAVPAIFFLMSYWLLKRDFFSSTMHVKNCRQIFIFWIFVSLISLLWVRKIYLLDFFVILLPFSVIISFGIGVYRQYWRAELLLSVSAILVITLNLLTLNSAGFRFTFPMNDYIVTQSPLPDTLKGKKILNMSDNPLYFIHNRLATPYLDWPFIKRDFTKLNNYKTIYEIYQRLIKDLPDFVVDENNLFESFLRKAPLMDKHYEKIQGTVIYRRKGMVE